jgi:protein-ribulosamine 3-kinase
MKPPDSIPSLFQQKIKELFPSSVKDVRILPVGGGSINQTYRLDLGEQSFFCKVNSASKFPQLFQKEKEGLELIARQKIIKTPEVIACFEEEGYQFLLMEWIREGEKNPVFWKKFGEQLAALHQVTCEHFGYTGNNYMGSVPQSNSLSDNWTGFFILERIEPLLKHCTGKQLLPAAYRAAIEKLYPVLPGIFSNAIKPALLHGDLWSGNFICNENSEPVLIDPAVYFGHPSVDLSMTTLFGGFSPGFYQAYNHHFPFPSNYKEQWDICLLYPLLIHLFLFGKSYLPAIGQIINRFER